MTYETNNLRLDEVDISEDRQGDMGISETRNDDMDVP